MICTLPSNNTRKSGRTRATFNTLSTVEKVDAGVSNTSPELNSFQLASRPPTTNTRPSCNNTAECDERGVFKLPAAEKPDTSAANNSAVPLASPPITNTLPLPKSVALCPARATLIDGPLVKAPVAGSKISVDVNAPEELRPPISSTRPSGNNVAD